MTDNNKNPQNQNPGQPNATTGQYQNAPPQTGQFVFFQEQEAVPFPNQAFYPNVNVPMSNTKGPQIWYGSFGAYEEMDAARQKKMLQLFTDESIRRAFIRKIYTVLTLQLVFTTAVIFTFILIEPVKQWVRKHIGVYILSLLVFCIVYIVLVCCTNIRRKFPSNYICLFILTLSMSYMMGAISCVHNTTSVVLAYSMTAALTLGITLFAVFTKIDFTKCYAFFVFIALAFSIFGMTCMIVLLAFGVNKILLVLYSGIGLVISSLFLCLDTQLILGGRFHSYSEEEYIVAVLDIYLDIVYIFLYLLSLIGFAGQD